MAAMYRYLICALFASLISAQVNTSTDLVSDVLSTVSSVVASVTSVIASATSVIDSATSELATATDTAVVSSLTSVISSAASVSSSAASVSSSAASVSASATSSITTTTPPVTTSSTPPPSTTTTSSSTVPSSSTVTSTSTSSSTTVVTTSSSSVSVSSSSTTSTSSPSSSSSSSEGERSSSESSASSTPTFVYTSSSASISYQETIYSTNAVIVTTQPDGSTQSRTELTVVQTVVPAATVYATTVVTSTESPTGITGLQAQGLSSNGSGLSTGAKAGIGAGVGVLVVAAAVIGVLYAMRRRKITRIGDEDRYTPSYGPSMIGGFVGIGKTRSRYSDSDTHAQQMRESNPLDRYNTGISNSQRTSLPNQSRNGATSDISSVSGVGSEQYRPGPGMPVVVEQPTRAYTPMTGVSELPSSDEHHSHHGYAAAATGNPFVQDDGQTSLYSDDGHQPIQPRATSPAALELSGENMMNRHPSAGSGGGPGGGQGYRGMDPEQPYHTRTQLQKPPTRPGHINPSQNF